MILYVWVFKGNKIVCCGYVVSIIFLEMSKIKGSKRVGCNMGNKVTYHV